MRRLLGLGAVVAVLLAAGGLAFFMAADDGSGSTAASAATVGGESQSGSAALLEQEQEGERPWLGVTLVQTPDGATISYVIADSPADASGLQRGDVVEAFDGTEVSNVREFLDQLEDKQVGDTVTLKISRDGQTQDVTVALEARPEALLPAIPMLPELEGIPVDELFSHMQGGEFRFTDADGNVVTAVLEAGTVASVDADAGTLTVDLNAGGSKTYAVEKDDFVCRGQLSDLEQGDNVTVMTVNDDVRAVFPGGGFPFFPGMGGRHGGFGPGHGRFGGGGFWNGGPGWFAGPDAAPEPAATGTGM